jgi:hypothetical protein
MTPLRAMIAGLLFGLALSSQAAADTCPTQVLHQREDMRERLAYVSRRGLEGDHHYFITFKTTAKGVVLPAALLAQHPDEMTIVLQYQFERLRVTTGQFEVMLWFKGVKTRVVVPFDAVSAFIDPSVKFRIDTDPAFLGVRCERV